MCQAVEMSKSIKERFCFPRLLTSERDRKQIIKAVFYVIMNMRSLVMKTITRELGELELEKPSQVR